MLHRHEESELVPSHQVYFAGCNLRCEFCSVLEWNEAPEAASVMNVDDLAKRIVERRRLGAKTLNLLGGEPAVNLVGILELLARIEPETQVVWNSNMYFNPQVDELLTGLVDIYLADFKCGSSSCARKILDAEDYVDVVRNSLLRVRGKARIIVRHVIMPGHFDCCIKPILHWLAETMPEVGISLKSDYIPPAKAVCAPADYVSDDERKSAIELAESLHLRLIV